MTGHGRDRKPAGPLRVMFAAGGTGGHLMPALATAEALERLLPCEFLLVGSHRESERRLRSLVPFPVVEVDARPIAGHGLAGKLRSLWGLAPAVLAARKHLRSFRPHLVVATGGYVCGPTGIAAWLQRVPLLVLEQNAAPGLTTRLLRPFAAALAVSFPQTMRALGSRAVLTGNPIRGALPAAPRRDGSPIPRAQGTGVHLLVLGGSQGARGLNAMVELALPLLARSAIGLRVTHQSGHDDVETLRAAYAAVGVPADVTPFIQNIGDAYASADLVCARAGATTLAELTYCGLPSILVPFPRAAADHQTLNARALAQAGAAVVVVEGPNGTPLADAVLALAADPTRLAAMAGAAAAAGRDSAALDVARLALDLASFSSPAPTTSETGRTPDDRPTTRENP